MLEPDWAQAFASQWIADWNARDLEAILAHYAEDVVFHSPRIALVMGAGQGFVAGKPALRAYWRAAIDRAPDLRFAFERLYCGSEALTIAYRNHRGQLAAETMLFDAGGRVRLGIAAYA